MQHFPFSLDQLKILKAIKTEKSFKKAAQKLYLSQPAISLQIQKLEQKIDFPVFERAKKQACFTTTGELMLDYATRILVLCEEADKALLYLKDIKKSRLLIGSSYTTGTYLVPKIIGLFCQQYSYANVKLEVNSTSRIAWSIANGELDIGIVGGEVPNELQNLLQIIPYVEDEIVLILPKFYRLKNMKKLDKEDLYKLKFVALKKSSAARANTDRVLKKNLIESYKLNIHLELNSIEALKSAVQTGLGAAFISIFALTDEAYLKTVNLVRIRHTKIKRTIYLVANTKTCKSKLFEKFNQYIINTLEKSKYRAFLKLLY